MIWDFSQLTPSPDLDWKPCYENLTCTILEVPLDYKNATAGTTGIAFIKYSSSNPDAEDILLNPGGPGGSGVELLSSSYQVLAQQLGPEYNLVSFDPRGVNNSGPSITCFPGADDDVKNVFYEKVFTPVDGTSEAELREGYRKSGVYGRYCSEVLSVNGTARYANTVAVAQDMLRYVETRAAVKGEDPKEAKLWYYGISYGTALGAVYATLFPNRIGRMILDSVLDTEDYLLDGWRAAATDTDAVIHSFFQYCFDAGPTKCAFHQNATSVEDLEERYLAIYNRFKKSPVEYFDNSVKYPITLTWQDASLLVFGTGAYNVYFAAPEIAQALALVEAGEYSLFALGDTEIYRPVGYDPREVRSLTSCLDLADRGNITDFASYKEYVQQQNNISFYGGPTLSAIVNSPCRELDIVPPENQIFSGKAGANAISVPILFVNNRLDPVTPLKSAYKVAGEFPDSRVVEVNATGHVSIFADPSGCVQKWVRSYLRDGKAGLPDEDQKCDPGRGPFDRSTQDADLRRHVRRWIV